MESIADKLVAKVKAGVDKLSVGRPEVRSLPGSQHLVCHVPCGRCVGCAAAGISCMLWVAW